MPNTELTFLGSLGVDAFGFGIVFIVLIALSLVIKLISIIIVSLQKKGTAETDAEGLPAASETDPSALTVQASDGELKLIDVDEKTAAMIMAIVSDESGIPLSQLRFSSIRLMK